MITGRTVLAWVGLLVGVVLLLGTAGTTAPAPIPPDLDRWLRDNRLGPYYAMDQVWPTIETAARREGKVVVYASSSRIGAAAAHFMQVYPGITVEAHPLGSAETIQKLSREMEARVYNVDVVTTGGLGDILHELLPKHYLFNFIPSTFAQEIPPERQQPLLVRIGEARAAFYNTERYPGQPPIRSYWDFTRPEWKGKIAIADPTRSATVFLHLAAVVKQRDYMAQDYRRVFGGNVRLSPGIPHAGYEWLFRVLKNDPVIISSSTRMPQVYGPPGQAAPPIALDSMTQLRLNEQQGYKIGVATDIPGVAYMTYMAVARQAPHPNAAKLFIRYLLGPRGLGTVRTQDLRPPYASGRSLDLLGGYAPWFDPGSFSPRRGAPVHPDAERYFRTMTFWEEDGAFIWNEGPKILEFWIRHQ